MSVTKGVKNNDSISASSFINQYESKNKLFDDVLENTLDYDLYGIDKRDKEYSRFNDSFENSEINTNNIRENHLDILKKSFDYHTKMMNTIGEQTDSLNKSYNYIGDMHRNQKFMTDYVKENKDKLENRNSHLIEDLENNKKQTEIYTYFYKKNKAQLNILYTLMYVILIIIVLTFLNMKFNFVINDTLYYMLISAISSIYFIYLLYQLFDLFLRNNINFDEYDSMFWSKEFVDPTVNLKNSTENKNITEQCFQDLYDNYVV
jgi:hypothetical protein